MLWKDQNYKTIVATFTVTLRFGIIVNYNIYLTTTTIRLFKSSEDVILYISEVYENDVVI